MPEHVWGSGAFVPTGACMGLLGSRPSFVSSTDEGLPVDTWFRDADGDGYGDQTEYVPSCGGSDYVDNRDDCDDLDPLVF